jgi:hypothetical protein
MAGVGSLLDLSGVIASNEVFSRQTAPLDPDRAIAGAWMLVGHSLRSVLPPVEKQAAADE